MAHRAWPPVPTPTPLDRIRPISTRPAGVEEQTIDEAEHTLGVAFPPEYRAYVTRFGEALDSLLVRVYPPARIVQELAAWRERVEDCWLWQPSADGFGPSEAQRALPLADTMQGDELVLWPERPGWLYVLPHEEEEVVALEGTFLGALSWMCETDALTDPTPLRWVAPLHDRYVVTFPCAGIDGAGALLATDAGASAVPLADSVLVLLPSVGGYALVTEAEISIEHDPPAGTLARVRAALAALGVAPSFERQLG